MQADITVFGTVGRRRGGALLALVVAVCLPLSAFAGDADVHFERAVEYQFQGNPHAAEIEYRRGLEIQPNSADAHAKLGVILLEHDGDVDGAISEFVTALGIDPHCSFCQSHLDEAVQARNSNAADDINKGNDFYRLGDLSRAVGAYKTAIYVDPNNAEAHNSLAWTLYRQGSLDEALSEVNEALRLKPGEPEYINTLACVLYDKGRLDAAMSEFQKAIARSKKPNPADLYGLALGYLSKGDTKRAVDSFREAVSLDPKYTDLSYLRDKVGMSVHALAAHEQLLSLSGEKQK